MKLRPFVLATLCSIVISSFLCPAETEADGPEKDQPSLSDHYRLALEIDPDNPNLHFSLGATLLAEGLHHEALVEFSRAYPAFIDSREMNFQLGLAYARTGDPDSALLFFNQAESLGAITEPELYPMANAYYALGTAYLEQDALEEAARLFSKTLAIDPARQEIHRSLGDIYVKIGQVEKGLSEFDAYMKIYPDDIATRDYVYTLYFNRARKFLEERNHQGARDNFNNALRANPGSPLAIYYLGYLDHREGRHERAAVRLADAYPASPGEIRRSMDSILYNSAQVLLEQRKPREALAAVAPLTAGEHAAMKDLYLAGVIHLILKEFEPARTCFERVLTLDPSHRGATMNLIAARSGAAEELFAKGRALYHEKEFLAALRHIEAALSIHPAHPGARAIREKINVQMEQEAASLFALAERLLQQNRTHDALKQIKAGLNLQPDSPLAKSLRELALEGLSGEFAEALEKGTRLARQGLLKEADMVFSLLLELDPSHEQARSERVQIAHRLGAEASRIAEQGDAALEDGRLVEAREAFEDALALAPELKEGADGLASIEALLTSMISEEVHWGRQAASAGRLPRARAHFSNALRLREDPVLRDELDTVERSISKEISARLDAAWRSLEIDNFRQAANLFQEALDRSPQHPDALKGLAEVATRSAAAVAAEIAAAEKDLEARTPHRALARYRRAVDIDPSNTEGREGLQRTLKVMKGKLSQLITSGSEALANGFFEEAERIFRNALTLDPYRRDALAAVRHLPHSSSLGGEPATATQSNQYLLQ